MLIGIDPGHGGTDPGAVNDQLNLQEKNLTLGIATRFQQLLEFNSVSTIMTRKKDEYVRLQRRAEILNNAKVNYVISIHVNSSTSPEPNYLSSHVVAKGGQAEQLAEKIQEHIIQSTGWVDGGVRVNNFFMVRETVAPAVLVELGFISNLDIAKQLAEDDTQRTLAEALAKGAMDHIGQEFNKPDNSFIDIKGHWAQSEIMWAIENGLMKGVSDSNFSPNEPLTRAQLAVVLKRFYEMVIE